MTPSKKPAIVLDFDRVLFDVDSFKVALRGAVKPLGISAKRWQTAYEVGSKSGVIVLAEMADELSRKTDIPAKQFNQAFDDEVSDAAWYLFADARQFLDRFSKACDLYLLTYGDPILQQQKVAATGIERSFQGVYYVNQPKNVCRVLPIPSVERAIFLNDNVTEMLELAQVFRWSHHLHINRGKPVEKPMPFPSYRDLRTAGEAVADLLNAQRGSVRPDSVPDQGSQAA